jgi:hypothetical protein
VSRHIVPQLGDKVASTAKRMAAVNFSSCVSSKRKSRPGDVGTADSPSGNVGARLMNG